jgi:predicted ATPase/DNA-binding SARP family transcriptional activator
MSVRRAGRIHTGHDRPGGRGAPSLLEIRLLGAFELRIDGRDVGTTGWRLRKATDLVKILALEPGHRLHRERLVDLLWPDKDPAAGANNLYQAVHAVRAALATPAAVGIHEAIVGLGDGALSVRVDVEEFEDIAGSAAGRTESLEHARSLYRGELLPDDPYAEWAIARRETLGPEQLSVLRELALAYERDGRRDASIHVLREALAIDPLNEELQRRVIRLEAEGGNRAAAVRRFQTLRAGLRTELDVEPAEETFEAYREALRGARPAAQGPPSNLPTPATSIVGRARELRDLAHSIRTTRLLTLTGTGGTGKTRLAIELAGISRGEFPDGLWFVELAMVTTSTLVARAVADALGLREAPGTSLQGQIASFLHGRRVLVLLDNCEHVVDAAAALVAGLLEAVPTATVLATSRQPLRVPGEVVFRVPSLAVGDPDASIEEGDDLPEATALFVARAQAANPQFRIGAENSRDVARLCYHLDGLPLALELAAARVGSISVRTLVDRLDERFALLVAGSRTSLSRHQTLEATLDWSYNLLGDDLRRVFRAAAAFPAGMSPEAAEVVCAADEGDGAAALSMLAELVDQSLLVFDDSGPAPRYRMLETVRHYARQRPVATAELEATERRLLEWAIALARGQRSVANDPSWVEHIRLVEREHDNLRAALERALTRAPGAALALAEALWPFWLWDGHLTEGRRWLTRTLDGSAGEPTLRARAMLGLGALTGRSGDPRRHAQLAAEAGAVFREEGDTAGEVRALQFRGIAHWAADELSLADEAFERSLAISTATGWQGGRAAALTCLGVVRAYTDGPRVAEGLVAEASALLVDANPGEVVPPMLDLGEAVVVDPATGTPRLVFEQTFAPFRDMSAREALGHLRLSQARLARQAGRQDRARVAIDDAQALFRADHDERGIADALASAAALDAELGRLADARRALGEALAIRRRLGDFRGAALAEGNLGNVELAEGRMEESVRHLTSAYESFRRHRDEWGLAASLGNLATLALRQGDEPGARRLLEDSLVACRSTGRRRWVAWTLVRLASLPDPEDHAAGIRAREALDIFRAIGDRAGAGVARTMLSSHRSRYVAAKVDPRPCARSRARR